ncbi:hypothetical protein J2783_002620 [Chryseobacterium sediminis]|nr:hypothetical protein [Chryseobacterium sediminis]
MSLCLSTVTYKNHKTVPVTGIILSRTLNKTLDLNKNLVLYIQFNLVDKSFADVLAELFFIFFILLEIAKTQVFLNAYYFKAQGFYLR